jgi:hypothetical protein
MFCAHPHVLRVYEIVSRKTDFYVDYVKMKKKGTKIGLFTTHFLSSLYMPIKMSTLNGSLHEHIECGDLHAHIFPIFDILNLFSG